MTMTFPPFMSAVAESARRGSELVNMADYVRGRERRKAAAEAGAPDEPVRRSAVLMLIAGTEPAEASVLVHERGHSLRSQPRQIAFPGGGREEQDASDVHTALREAHEELTVDPAAVTIAGVFAPVTMPLRRHVVAPVLAWAPERPLVRRGDPVEVQRPVWAALSGHGSLTDPGVLRRGYLGEVEVGPVFMLDKDVVIWGFTAYLLSGLITGVTASGQLDGSLGDYRTAPPLTIPASLRG